MTLSLLKEQGPMLRILAKVAGQALWRRPTAVAGGAAEESRSSQVRAPSPALVEAFVRAVGGEGASPNRHLPIALAPQWIMPAAFAAIEGAGYPLLSVMNAGVRFESRAPLPIGGTLSLRSKLVGVDDDGRRAILTVRVVTESSSCADALTSEVRAFVPLSKQKGEKRAPIVVPGEAQSLSRLRLGKRAGLSFATVTGDFNPIHWVHLYARAFGFRGQILHGFGTLAWAVAALERHRQEGWWSDEFAPRWIDARFTRPLVLPAEVGVFVRPGDDRGREIYVGDAPSEAAYLTGTFGALAE